MHVWNMLHTASWKYRTQKSPSAHHHTNLSGYIFVTKAHIDNRKKLVKEQYLSHMFLKYYELRPTNGWDLLASLGHSSKFQWVSLLGSVTARHTSSGHQPNFVALNRGCHLYSAGQPSCWALAHILVLTLTVHFLAAKKSQTPFMIGLVSCTPYVCNLEINFLWGTLSKASSKITINSINVTTTF